MSQRESDPTEQDRGHPPEAGDPPSGRDLDEAPRAAESRQESSAFEPSGEPAAGTPPEQEREPETRPAAPDPAPAASSTDSTHDGGGGGGARLALVLALAAAGLSAYVWWQGTRQAPAAVTDAASGAEVEASISDATGRLASRLTGELDERLAEQAGRFEAEISSLRSELATLRSSVEGLGNASARLAELEGEVAGMSGRLDSVATEARSAGRQATTTEAALSEQLSALDRRFDTIQSAVNQMAELRRTGEDALRIAEAEFLLRLASERLSLFDDVTGAQKAMEIAARYLQAVDDPLYNGVRRTLSAEIDRLAAVEMPDRAALSGRLQQLAEASAAWPLDDRRTLDRSANLLEPTERVEGWWGRVRAVISDVAVVHRDTGDGTILLTLDEERLLRENVHLQLQVAQLALVRSEQALYDSALAIVAGWLESYYDTGSEAVTRALASLRELSELTVNPELPELGTALRELRQARTTGGLAESSP